jgi:CIC family chloride channel protein
MRRICDITAPSISIPHHINRDPQNSSLKLKFSGEDAVLLLEEMMASAGIGVIVGLSTIFVYEFYIHIDFIRSTLVGISRYFTVICTIIGLLISYSVVKKFAIAKSTGCGTAQVIEAYNYRGGLINFKDFSSKVVASVITIGLGGSAGLEGPSLLLGGGVASTVIQRFHLTREKARNFMLAGAAAGIAAIFKAPLTGILFALEIPFRRHFAKDVFVPASISSVASYLTFALIMGKETIFIPTIRLNLSLSDIAYSLPLGVLAALVGLVFVTLFRAAESRAVLSSRRIFLPLIGGSIIGVFGFIRPEVLGIGYQVVSQAAAGELYRASILFLITLIILKILTTTITLNFGGNGGLFIPSIYVGAVLGVIYVKALNLGSDEILVMASIAAMIAATNKTLLTSIAFVAETLGPSSIIPTVIAASTSYITSGRSCFYESQLPKEPVEEEKALAELRYLTRQGFMSEAERIKVGDVMVRKPIAIKEDATVMDAFKIMDEHVFRVYPVIDGESRIVGVVKIEDILSLPMERWGLPVSQVTLKFPLLSLKDDDVLDVIEKMLEKDEDHVYVVSDTKSMKLIGVISAIDLIKILLEEVLVK